MYLAQTQPPVSDPYMNLGLLAIGALLFIAVTGFFFWRDFRRTRWLYKVWLTATESNVVVVAVLWIFVISWGMPLTYFLWAVTLPLKLLIWFIRYRRLRAGFVKGALKERPVQAQPETLLLSDGAATVTTAEGIEVIQGELIVAPQPPQRKLGIELATGLTQMTNTPFADIQAVCNYFISRYVNDGLSAYEYIGVGPNSGGNQIDIIRKRDRRVQFSAVARGGQVTHILKAVPREKRPELPPPSD